MGSTLRFGLVGCRRGLVLAEASRLNPSATITAVCDRNPGRAREAAEKYAADYYTEFEDMLESDIDAVLVASPPVSHAALSIAAAEKGLDVLCEVPAVATIEEASRLYEAVRRTGIVYMIAENVCYFDNVDTMRRVVAEGRIGSVYYAEGEYVHDCRAIFADRDDGLGGGVGGKGTWRTSLPPIHYCTHELGPLLMITRDPIVEASAFETGPRVAGGFGASDLEAALFRTASGSVVRLVCGFSVEREPAHHFLGLYGTEGSIETDRYNPYENLKAYFKNRSSEGRVDLPAQRSSLDERASAFTGGHGRSEYYMVDEFIRRIADRDAHGVKLHLGVEDALNMSLPGICAHASSISGGLKVEVPTF